MSDDELLITFACAALGAHVLVLVACLWLQGSARLVLLLNVGIALVVLASNVETVDDAVVAGDVPLLALLGFELLVLPAAYWAHRGRHLPRLFSYAAFVLHLCASAAAVLFALTFRITRLI